MNHPRKSFPYWTLIVIAAALVLGGLVRAGVLHLPGYQIHAAPAVTVQEAQSAHARQPGRFQKRLCLGHRSGPPRRGQHLLDQGGQAATAPDMFDDPFFRQFFGNQFGQQQQQQQPQTQHEYSLGSGVIVNPDGYMLTNNHVVSGASDVEVSTQNHKEFKAKVIGTDPAHRHRRAQDRRHRPAYGDPRRLRQAQGRRPRLRHRRPLRHR